MNVCINSDIFQQKLLNDYSVPETVLEPEQRIGYFLISPEVHNLEKC